MIDLLMCILLTIAGVADTMPEADTEIRENPAIENAAPRAGADSLPQVRIPAYIHRDANHIDLNGADWSDLRGRLAAAADSAISIVHIGDSHLQADFATAVVRSRLHESYGSAGRGLVIPFRMAGTNEPRDYAITSTDGMVTSRMMRMPWPTEMTFTGIAVAPASPGPFTLRVSAREPFDRLTFIATSTGLSVRAASAHGLPVRYDTISSGTNVEVRLDRPAIEAAVTLTAADGTALGGIELRRGHSGVAYHVIGNNGATYSTYTLTGNPGRGVSALKPSLIIVSLGTNEAFGRTTDAAFRADLDMLVSDLRRHNPDAELLLVTPAECYRRSVTRRGRGRRRRRVTTYAVNPNIRRIRDVIASYARERHIPLYDWYEVAGGAGSAARWLADRNLGRDRIHLTADGYRLQGALMADALLNAFSPDSQ